MAENPLAIDFTGIPFENPFMLSSAPPTLDAKRVIRAANPLSIHAHAWVQYVYMESRSG